MTTAYLCGRYIELYTNRLSQPKKPRNRGFKKDTIDSNSKAIYTYQSYHRAKQNVKRLLFTNLTGQPYRDIFFTLTYADNMQDYQQSQQDFNRFRSRCRKFGFNFPYLIISERQKRGAIHHHGVFFNTGRVDIQLLSKLWSHGYIWVNFVNYNKPRTALANYMTKYITKQSDKTMYSKYYRSSYSLQRPLKYIAPLYVPRIHIPHKIVHKSQYTPLYSEPVQYSLIELQPDEYPTILDNLHIAPDSQGFNMPFTI